MKVVTVVGARPQFIKAAVVSRAMAKHIDRVREEIIHTGQHFDDNMSDVFFRELGIPAPAHHLGIGGGHHGAMTGRMLEAIEQVLLQSKPDWVLVYGDTNSTLAGALAAVKLHIRVAHVEAGLRSFNRKMPEEVNRVLTDHAADLLFAPTEAAIENLRREGIAPDKIVKTGDVMYDAMLHHLALARRQSTIMQRLNLNSDRFVLATVHRAENTDDEQRLRGVMRGLIGLAEQLPVILPLHPRTRKALISAEMLDEVSRRVRVIEPIGYLDMVMLESAAALIATDSGGVQKEAYFHRVPCLTLRDETEWIELVEAGANFLVGTDATKIMEIGMRALKTTIDRTSLYGDGKAGEAIVERLLHTEP